MGLRVFGGFADLGGQRVDAADVGHVARELLPEPRLQGGGAYAGVDGLLAMFLECNPVQCGDLSVAVHFLFVFDLQSDHTNKEAPGV